MADTGRKRLTVRQGVYYFRDYRDAAEYATANGMPTDRIIHYTAGYAIQFRVSGPYAGPDQNSPQPAFSGYVRNGTSRTT